MYTCVRNKPVWCYPFSLLMTEWYWSGSLDAFADMCNLRCKDDTQAETREVAMQIDHKMIELFPVSWDALTENDDG